VSYTRYDCSKHKTTSALYCFNVEKSLTNVHFCHEKYYLCAINVKCWRHINPTFTSCTKKKRLRSAFSKWTAHQKMKRLRRRPPCHRPSSRRPRKWPPVCRSPRPAANRAPTRRQKSARSSARKERSSNCNSWQDPAVAAVGTATVLALFLRSVRQGRWQQQRTREQRW